MLFLLNTLGFSLIGLTTVSLLVDCVRGEGA